MYVNYCHRDGVVDNFILKHQKVYFLTNPPWPGATTTDENSGITGNYYRHKEFISLLIALENGPYLLEILFPQSLPGYPEVEPAAISPHHTVVALIGIHLH